MNYASPVVVVQVLAYECVWLHRAVHVHLRHVEVVDEVDEPFSRWGSKFTTGFLLQGFLQDTWRTNKHTKTANIEG